MLRDTLSLLLYQTSARALALAVVVDFTDRPHNWSTDLCFYERGTCTCFYNLNILPFFPKRVRTSAAAVVRKRPRRERVRMVSSNRHFPQGYRNYAANKPVLAQKL